MSSFNFLLADDKKKEILQCLTNNEHYKPNLNKPQGTTKIDSDGLLGKAGDGLNDSGQTLDNSQGAFSLA